MTKSTWETSRDVDAMIAELDRANLDRARPSRLLACAFGRLSWHILRDRLGRPSVELVERFVDGRATWDDLRREDGIVRNDRSSLPAREQAIARASVEILMAFENSGRRAGQVARSLREAASAGEREGLAAAQCDLIRDIFGNPFEPVRFDPDWSTPDVLEVARAIHDDRAFDRMPILGDALEEAGCSSDRVLDHCRGAKIHARGCWVVDHLIGGRAP
jgi:hypothetical protein